MPTLTINGRSVSVDDSFLNLPREEQDATVEEIAKSLPQDKPSGTFAGLHHGMTEAVHGNMETAKDFLGANVDTTRKPNNFVPANVTNGSFNPLKWNYSQIPQKVAEQLPGLGQDIAAATAASKLTPGGLKAKALAGLISGAGSAWMRTAGDTAKDVAANRTGTADAPVEGQDLLRGGLTAAGSAALGALTPTRFIPGTNKVLAVGAEGALAGAKKALATAGIGAGSSAASDAVTQLGTKGSYDPSQGLEAAVGGGLTAGTLATPRALADVGRAATLSKFGGDNLEATKNYATRLQQASENLGNSASDYKAHDTVKTDLKNELVDAAKAVRANGPISSDLDNALQRAQTDKPLTAQDVDLITKGAANAPDGANAAYLARTMRVAQLAQERGSYDTKGRWAGGLSGVMDKNLGFMLNPVRIGGGVLASLGGMHLLGLSNPMFAGSVAAGYGGARLVDAMAGMRSPAKTFAEHFADRNAQLRLPPTAPTAPAAPVQAPSPAGPMGPWGPKPLPEQSVPQVAPQVPAAPEPLSPSQVKAALAQLKAQTITKKNGKVESSVEDSAPFEPLAEEHLYPRDISAKEYAAREAAGHGANSPIYAPKAEATATRRINAETELVGKYPEFTHAIKGLVRQLHRVGRNPQEVSKAVEHFAAFVSPAAAQEMRASFK